MRTDSDLKRVAGLWVQEKNGRKYLSGKLDERVILEPGMKLFIFAAKERRTEKSPSHNLFVAPPRGRQGDDEDRAF
jgi:hypothetical protein